MRFVAERILPAYLRALDEALDDALERLPAGRLRRLVILLRRGAPRRRPDRRFRALQRLAQLGEAQGWLTADEAMILRKLGYRVAVLERRSSDETVQEPRDSWLRAWRERAASPTLKEAEVD